VGDFITGVLVENEAGATYEGHVYDRFLKLRLSDGQILAVFDPPGSFGPISTILSKGEVYEMILMTLPIPKSVQYFPASPLLSLDVDVWQGEIIEPHWVLPEGRYKLTHSYLSEREWVLLATRRGQLLMSPKVFSIPLSRGGIVQWDNVRLDLCAVV